MKKSNIVKNKRIAVRFKPRARLLLQLGDQLIKNESIALVELVKNSYDADASHVKVTMENIDDASKGVIRIEDDGCGMDVDTVKNVWMEPGSDFKSQKFKNRELSPKFKRLPIGEKGIGRFGAHKLGNHIEMTTRKMNGKEVFVKIDWRDFDKHQYLEDVSISIVERNSPIAFKGNKTGTIISIKNLKKNWTRGELRGIKRTITALSSPFIKNESFFTELIVPGKEGWLDFLLDWKDISEYALYNFKVKLDKNSIKNFNYQFSPWVSMPRIDGRKVSFNENNFHRYFSNEEKLIDLFSRLDDKNEDFLASGDYSFGEIEMEGYIFDMDNYILRLGVSDKQGLKEYFQANGGIRVFRDGLRIYDYGEPENDWLGLDIQRVNQPTKKISNNIIIGAVYLKRNESSELIEKTNREGFVENKAYLAFKDSILRVIKIVETLRYSDKLRLRSIYGPTRKSEPVLQIIGDLQDFVNKSEMKSETRKEISKYLVKLEVDYIRINETLLKAAGAGLSMTVVIHEVEKIILEIVKVLEIENASDRLLYLVKHLSNLIDGYSEIIKASSQKTEDIAKVINQALINSEYRCKAHKINVVKAYKEFYGNAKVKVNRSLVIGAIMNLVDNSIYWLEKSGRREKEIFVDISENEVGYLTILVADNGTGFLLPTDEITEPFVSAKPDGMGLGLHITSEIISAHKGKLHFPLWGDFNLPDGFKNGAIVALSFKKDIV